MKSEAPLLDLGLPDMDGVDVIKALRGWSRVPVLVLSARRASDEKVAALTKSNYLRVYMAQLRRKLEADPSHPRFLITEPGMGYRFEG